MAAYRLRSDATGEKKDPREEIASSEMHEEKGAERATSIRMGKSWSSDEYVNNVAA